MCLTNDGRRCYTQDHFAVIKGFTEYCYMTPIKDLL